MPNPFPRRNLPPEAEPWGREHDNRVGSLETQATILTGQSASLRAQVQGLTRIQTEIPRFRFANANANGNFTIPSSTYSTVVSGSLTAPVGMSRGLLLVNSTVVKTPDDPEVTNNWVASQVEIYSGDTSFTVPGANYYGYREPSQYGREVSLISDAGEFGFEASDTEYEITFQLRVACGLPSFIDTDPGDIASVSVVALFYGTVTPPDTV